MAKRLQLIDFKSQGDEKPLEFDCSDENATILDVKRVIDKEEGLKLKDLSKITIYWQFALLQDDISVKDLLDQNVSELNFSLPQYASITSDKETMVFSKGKNIFNQGVNKACLKLHPGCAEEFRIPARGKFAVLQSKIEGRDRSYYVRYYEVEDEWKIEINVDREHIHNFKVFQVLENGDKKELKASAAKEFSMEDGTLFANAGFAGPYVGAIVSIVTTIASFLI